jgi:hypothetical protein
MWSTKKEGFPKPPDVSDDDFSIITNNEPARWAKDPGYLAAFKKTFGAVAVVYLDLFSKVPMNIDKNFVGPGIPVEVIVNAAGPSTSIPAGEPISYTLVRIERKINGILEVLTVR